MLLKVVLRYDDAQGGYETCPEEDDESKCMKKTGQKAGTRLMYFCGKEDGRISAQVKGREKFRS